MAPEKPAPFAGTTNSSRKDMMHTFAPVSPPAWGQAAKTAAAVLTSIDAWSDNAALGALVSCFGGRVPDGDTGQRLGWLDEFSARHWDFRGGQERNLARSAEFDAETTSLILDVAAALGLTSSTPPTRRSYTHLLILGGLVRACLLRPRFAADLLNAGLAVGSVSALSTYRPLMGNEIELVEALGQSGKTNEMEVMEAGLTAAFELGQPVDEERHEEPGAEFATALVRTWRAGELPVRLVIAPSPEPTIRRANTADTYAYWAGSCVHLGPGDSVLLVTSSIYLPYQHCDAVRMLALPHGCSVETVGIDFSDPGLGALRQSFTPANYLQEIRSAIRGVHALHTAAASMPTDTNRG